MFDHWNKYDQFNSQAGSTDELSRMCDGAVWGTVTNIIIVGIAIV